MKTSNKLLITVTVIVFIFLVIYDYGLQAEYLKGAFRSRFFKMEQLSFKNFSNVKCNAADVMGVTIEKGTEYKVWIRTDMKDKVAVSQQGKTLVIRFNEKNSYFAYDNSIIITCPQLDTVTTTANEEPLKKRPQFTGGGYTNVNGFEQHKMVMVVNRLTGMFLAGNKIDELQAIVGDKLIGSANLSIKKTNQIKQANIQVVGKSDLKLDNPGIEKLNYDISDSAKVTLTGKSLQLFKK